jgi:hypothetical protein
LQKRKWQIPRRSKPVIWLFPSLDIPYDLSANQMCYSQRLTPSISSVYFMSILKGRRKFCSHPAVKWEKLAELPKREFSWRL